MTANGACGACARAWRECSLRVRASTGWKLNHAIEAARGDILQNVDDDDYWAALSRFLQAQLRDRDPARTLVTRCCFLTLVGSDSVLRHSGEGWTCRRRLLLSSGDVKRIRFREEDVSYDTHFRYDHQPEIVRICDPDKQYIVVRHGSNNWNSVKNKDTNRTMSTNDYLRGLAPYKKTARELPTATGGVLWLVCWCGGGAVEAAQLKFAPSIHWRPWILSNVGISPDGGNGMFEAAILVTLAAALAVVVWRVRRSGRS